MLIGMIVSGALLVTAGILVVTGIRATLVLWSGDGRNRSDRSAPKPQPVNADAHISAAAPATRSEQSVAGVTTLKALQS